MYTGVENMETVPDEEVEKREQLMIHRKLFSEVICDLNNNGKKASKVIVLFSAK